MTWHKGRGYRWEPFEDENAAALKHGADSPRVVGAAREIVRAELLKAAPWLDQPVFEAAVARYERAEAVARLLTDYIARKVAEGGVETVPKHLWPERRNADKLAGDLSGALGLTPAAQARIRRDLAAVGTGGTLDALLEQGRTIRAALEGVKARAEAPPSPDAERAAPGTLEPSPGESEP